MEQPPIRPEGCSTCFATRATESVSCSTSTGSSASAASCAAFGPLIPTRGTKTPVVPHNAQRSMLNAVSTSADRALLMPPLPGGETKDQGERRRVIPGSSVKARLAAAFSDAGAAVSRDLAND